MHRKEIIFKNSEITEKKTDLNVLQKTVSFELLKKNKKNKTLPGTKYI